MGLKKNVLLAKQRAGLAFESRRLPGRPFSIISDDCWGGQVYRYHKLPYLTPTVGLQVMHTDFMRFIRNLDRPDFLDFREERLTSKYPCIRSPYALIFCVHYETSESAIEAFRRRYKRIVWDNLFYKVDFGKPWYSPEDIDEWNSMALPRSVALTYRAMKKRGRPCGKIHNQIELHHWRRSGTAMYFASRRHFDLMHFLETGEIRKTRLLDGLVYRLFTDIWWPGDVRRPWDNQHDDFALRLEECLLSNPEGAPKPYEVEVQ
jgi:uncharacterized protein (DUF1919 family)